MKTKRLIYARTLLIILLALHLLGFDHWLGHQGWFRKASYKAVMRGIKCQVLHRGR